MADLAAGRLNAKTVAVLGMLTAINAVLRLPAGPGDAPTFFFLVILAGYAYGARFGFLLGALSLLVSALLTGGVGPWMPFQMFVMGWMGLGAGALRPLARRLAPGGRAELLLLCAYGYAWGLLFGALMNLWSWPLIGAGALYWQPGLGLARRCSATGRSTPPPRWPGTLLRALTNVLLIGALGRPVLKELRRFQRRFHVDFYA
ncbi:ECF transporter S component [Kouleothrix sp.]|uniref:ECF transporter S component n=1 Tax=Kouleothrix sp. TaxID=2779161 RepID=UPI003918FD0C